MQGWTPDFIPKLTGDAVDMKLIDRILPIANADAHALQPASSRSKEGIFVGITSGATFAGALEVCAEAPKGATMLCMLPDTGERYLSTPLFADIRRRHERRGTGDLAFDAGLLRWGLKSTGARSGHQCRLYLAPDKGGRCAPSQP